MYLNDLVITEQLICVICICQGLDKPKLNIYFFGFVISGKKKTFHVRLLTSADGCATALTWPSGTKSGLSPMSARAENTGSISTLTKL